MFADSAFVDTLLVLLNGKDAWFEKKNTNRAHFPLSSGQQSCWQLQLPLGYVRKNTFYSIGIGFVQCSIRQALIFWTNN
ncbi:unnamed protein product [Pseudo-nitzschia multistriata]|uniref:Uncharacterized protein n=1 Tax=Pseudo-nitzschia multistriata TaxID=183589 RepID=A0A448Z1M5_9STRA|nr:unnamed protein product [Pseudo-nitzschia multistriata]